MNKKRISRETCMSPEDFQTSFTGLPIIAKLDQLVSKEMTFYKDNCRQRCFKCRKYGHIAKDCDKVCKQCYYFHPGKICVINIIQMMEELIQINYLKFIRMYDETVKAINKIKEHSFNNMSVISSASFSTICNKRIPYNKVTKQVLVGKLDEIQNMMNNQLCKMINIENEQYALQNNVPVKSIRVLNFNNFPDPKKGLTFDITPTYKKIFNENKVLGVIIKGSLKEVQMNYIINQIKDDTILIKNNSVYRNEVSTVKPLQVIQLSKNCYYKMKYNYKRIEENKLDRFNKVLRLYVNHDELFEKQQELLKVKNELNDIQKKLNDRTYDIALAKMRYDENLANLRSKYKMIKEDLINKTRQYKEKQYQKMDKIQQQCKQKTQLQIKKNKLYVQKAFNDMKAEADYEVVNLLSTFIHQVEIKNWYIDKIENSNGITTITYQVSSVNGKFTKKFRSNIPVQYSQKIMANATQEREKQIKIVKNLLDEVRKEAKGYKNVIRNEINVIKDEISSKSCRNYDSEGSDED